MPKSANQKLKLLHLLDIFKKQTDEEHMITISKLQQELLSRGISAERKSLYDDIDALIQFGYNIISVRKGANYYYLADDEFELPELKLLADAVASAKFITQKKSNELIKKIEGLTSNYQASQITRQIAVVNRVKTSNEKIYYNVDTLHMAISQNKAIKFDYFQYNIDGKKEYKYKNERYQASPYSLLWDDENYYLIAYYDRTKKIHHFRVDKMENIDILEEDTSTPPDGFDISSYSNKLFSMFGGEESFVKILFDNSLIGVVNDRFGQDVIKIRQDDNSFTVNVKVVVSPAFFSWIFQFGKKAKILSPKEVSDKAKDMIKQLNDIYKND